MPWLDALTAAILLALLLRHDTWLWLGAWSGEEGARVSIRTGNRFPVSDVATRPERIAHTVGLAKDASWTLGENELTCACGDEPIVGVVLHPRTIALDAEPFADYLREEGHPEPEGLAGAQPESYTKCAKAIASGHLAPLLGHPLELVGDLGGFRAYREGSPMPSLLVRAYSTEGREAQAIGALQLPAPGTWMVRTHVIERSGSEWRSVWASLTLRV